jgi:energy-converting hydrogenase A subunit M
MAETLGALFLKIRALLNKYTEEGLLISEEEIIDLQKKAIPLIDIGHKELFESAKSNAEQEEPITLMTIDDVTQVNYKADQALVYYAAARLALFDNKELVQFFEDKFEQLKSTCKNKATFVIIENVYEEEG